jgi:hypothetical protein
MPPLKLVEGKKMSDRFVELIFNMIDYIKDREEILEEIWGNGRNFNQLLDDEEVPEIFIDCTNILKFMGIDNKEIIERIKGGK